MLLVPLPEAQHVRGACVAVVVDYLVRLAGDGSSRHQQQSSPVSEVCAGEETLMTLLCGDWADSVESALGRTARRPQDMLGHCLSNAETHVNQRALVLVSFA